MFLNWAVVTILFSFIRESRGTYRKPSLGDLATKDRRGQQTKEGSRTQDYTACSSLTQGMLTDGSVDPGCHKTRNSCTLCKVFMSTRQARAHLSAPSQEILTF